MARNRRRYGGYIVHAGFALLLIAVAASSSFQTSEDLRLMPGKSAQVGDYTVTYVRPTQSIDPKELRGRGDERGRAPRDRRRRHLDRHAP